MKMTQTMTICTTARSSRATMALICIDYRALKTGKRRMADLACVHAKVHAGVPNCVSQIGPYLNGHMQVPLHMHTCSCGNLPILDD